MTDIPKPSSGDLGHALAKAGLNLIPVVGGTAAELFALLLAPPLAKRRDKWLEDLAADLKKVEGRLNGFKMESLSQNQVFVSAFLQASQAAMRTHEEEKLMALRNALIHIAISKLLKEDMQIFFLGLVDSFTVTHIELLRIFGAPGSSVQRRAELGQRRIITDSILTDLNTRGLLEDPRPFTARSRESTQPLVLLEWKLSELGRGFVNFVSRPYDS